MSLVVQTYPFRGKNFVRGRGSYLYDAEGERYLDMMTNYGVNIFGQGNPVIIRSIQKQLPRLANLHGSFANDVRAQASREIVRRCDGKLGKVYWSNSGSEAIEAAVKFAIVATGKTRFVAAHGAYHGKTLGALALTWGKKYRKAFKDVLFSISHVEYGDAQVLRKAVKRGTAAVVLEPIQGESGVIVPPAGYLKEAEKICRSKGVLLVLDEIQTGLGRTGSFLACQQENVEPDIICLGKGLGGGIPLGATLVSARIASKLTKGIHTSTLGGSPVACTGVVAILGLLDNRVLRHVEELGSYFLGRLKEIGSSDIVDVRGRGLMIGVEVRGKNTPVLKALQERRILACPAADNVVRFLPAYTITRKEIDETVEALESCVGS